MSEEEALHAEIDQLRTAMREASAYIDELRAVVFKYGFAAQKNAEAYEAMLKAWEEYFKTVDEETTLLQDKAAQRLATETARIHEQGRNAWRAIEQEAPAVARKRLTFSRAQLANADYERRRAAGEPVTLYSIAQAWGLDEAYLRRWRSSNKRDVT